MSVATAAERTLLNTLPHRSKLYLSIFQPSVALICQVNGSYDADNQTVNYDGVVSGSYLNIHDYDYQVALIGTSPNSEDVGRTWVRSATSSTLRFLESDHIAWADNLYITVLKYTEIIPVFPRIIQNPSNEEDVIFYKVWDVAYTNQNSILGTFIAMGSDFAGFVSNSTGTCYWSASGTSNVRGDALTYSWSFEGATVTGSTAHTPGNISWNQPGQYRVILDTTSASGKVDRSIRYVSWYDRPGEGPNTPILNFEFTELGGSRDGVGFTGRIKVRQSIPYNVIYPGALIVIFKEDWYGSTKQSLNKSSLGRGSIFFVGYINEETVQWNNVDSFVEFQVFSPTNMMEITETFSVSVESSTNPSTWYQLYNMSIKRALYHYYAWHSSVLLRTDFIVDNSVDKSIQFFDADRTSLYDAGNSLVDGARRSRMLSNSLGQIYVEEDVSIKESAATTIPVALYVDDNDLIETPNIDVRTQTEVSFIELGGIAFDPATSASTALLSSAPGTAPAYRGSPERKQGLALDDQDDLNTIVGNLFAYRNSKYPKGNLAFRGNFGNLDIAPQEQIKLTTTIPRTPRNISFTNKSFAIREISWSWDSVNEILLPKVGVSEITQGTLSTTISIPIEPPDTTGGGGGGSIRQPPIQIPPIPTVTGGTGVIGINVYENGVYKGTSLDFNFVGSILRVQMTWITGSSIEAGYYINSGSAENVMANIIFDACGCTGTFSFL